MPRMQLPIGFAGSPSDDGFAVRFRNEFGGPATLFWQSPDSGEEVNAPQFMLRLGDLKLIQYGEQPPFISYPPQLFNVRHPYAARRANFRDRHSPRSASR